MSTAVFSISGLACIALALFLMHSPSLGLDLEGHGYQAWLRDGLSALVLLVVAAVIGLPARPGAAFGSLAALSLAPVISFTIAALAGTHPALSMLGGSVLGLLMIPVLRERGIISLLVVSVVVSLALVGARRQSLVLAEEAREISFLAAMISEGERQRHFIAVADDYPLRQRRRLALSLWPADQAQRIDLLCVEAGSLVEAQLSAAGWRGLRIEDRGYMILAPQPSEQGLGITFGRAELGLDGPSLTVEQVLEGNYLLRVLTPCGSLQELYEQPGGLLRLSRQRREEYARLVAGLPAGMPILLRLEARLGPARSAWTLLRIPQRAPGVATK